MTTTVEYLNILNSLENITDVGLVYQSTPDNYYDRRKDLESRYDEFKTCCEWIEKFRFLPTEKQFRKYVQVQRYNSYYLKHLVEKWSGSYISNGAFIAAVKFLNIPFKPIWGTPDVSVTIFLSEKAALL